MIHLSRDFLIYRPSRHKESERCLKQNRSTARPKISILKESLNLNHPVALSVCVYCTYTKRLKVNAKRSLTKSQLLFV